MKKIIALFVLTGFLMFFLPNVKTSEAATTLVPVYSFWSKTSLYRYLTASVSEKNSLAASNNWEGEGIV